MHSLPLWLEECEKHNLTNQVPRILVGNKCDCRESVAVNTNLAQRIADAHNMPGYNLDSRNWTSLDYKPHTFLIWTPGRQSWFLTGSKSPVNGLVNVEGIKIILVEENQFKQLFETSAMSESEGGTIEAIFLTLAHKLIRQRPMMPVPMMASLELNENLHRANVISITRSPKQADEVSEAPWIEEDEEDSSPIYGSDNESDVPSEHSTHDTGTEQSGKVIGSQKIQIQPYHSSHEWLADE
ncbi:hypothetical protein J6590_064706 [Homalodisca vitripennis]|nr:hypothetical protein J6590_064706 [Homalodisca vitripennis]